MMPSIFGTSSVQSMMKTMQLQMKWTKRQEDITKAQQEDPQIAQLRKDAAQARKSSSIMAIDGKLSAGQPISVEELEYLQENAPDLYQKALEIARERKAFKNALANCRTQEEVDRVKANVSQRFVSEAKSISANANIPRGKKVELLTQINRRMMMVESEHAAFIKAGNYDALPTEQEVQEQEKATKKEKPPAKMEDVLPPPNYGKEPELPIEGETPDSPKIDSPKVDAPKVDAPKVDAPKVDAPKVNPPKPAATPTAVKFSGKA